MNYNYSIALLLLTLSGVLMFHQAEAQRIEKDAPHVVEIAGAKWVIDSSYSYRWDRDNWNWELARRTVNVERYNDGYLKTKITSSWDPASEIWTPVSRYHQPNALVVPNAVIVDSSDIWDAVNEKWEKSEKSITRFNQDAKYTHYTVYDWDKVKQKWHANYKNDIEYTDSTTTNSSYFVDPLDDTWVGNRKSISYHNPKVIDRYKWDKENKEWYLSNRSDYSEPPYSTLYKWDRQAERFIPFNRSYLDTIGAIVKRITQVWDSKQKDWVNNSASYRVTSTSDPISTAYIQAWDIQNNLWFTRRKTEKYQQDQDGIRKSVTSSRTLSDTTWKAVLQSFQTYDEANQLLLSEVYSWSENVMQWKGTSKYQNFWGQFVSTSTKATDQPSFTVYPNPCTDYLYISAEELEGKPAQLWSLDGHLTVRPIRNQSINVSNLKAGMYRIVVVLDKDREWTISCIKK